MGIVYVLGAGTSHGDRLATLESAPPGAPTTGASPPLVKGFFAKDLYDAMHYTGADAERDFPDAFAYIRRSKEIADPVGEGQWRELDLEQIFTSIELEREFRSPESDEASRTVLIRNQLVRYIKRVLSLCTSWRYGEFSRRLASSLDVDDSIITFNWDLLVDQELVPLDLHGGNQRLSAQYNNFLVTLLEQSFRQGTTPMIMGTPGRYGMLLKMHGSLSWYVCGNSKCPGSSRIAIDHDPRTCLSREMGIGLASCQRCGSELTPLLIPPLLRKPITENPMIRSVWGLAVQRLTAADKVVIIGFSAAPTDFYAAWLVRSALGVRKDVEIYVVNPGNGAGGDVDFQARMRDILPHGFNSDFRLFSEIERILEKTRE